MSVRSVTQNRRSEIATRKGTGGETRVVLAQLRDEDELAFAIRYAMDHYTYKRSKGSEGTTQKTVTEVANAVAKAAESYMTDVTDPLDLNFEPEEAPADDQGPVSGLGSKIIRNPYGYIRR